VEVKILHCKLLKVQNHLVFKSSLNRPEKNSSAIIDIVCRAHVGQTLSHSWNRHNFTRQHFQTRFQNEGSREVLLIYN